ncbi:hypothetical protein [Pseudactinotalea sp.]|uniref:hypothetical protein n=1 Tax=Pseudactinotalea sp. TaxID=1926260 RepID=UPI003B3ACCFB
MSTIDPHGRRVLDARLHLLDRQVIGADGEPVTTVDDLEIVGPDGGEVTPGAPAHLAAVLTGPVLVTRILGGHPPPSRWERIEWRHVVAVGTTLELDVSADDLDLDWVERWVREHVIHRIPGGAHDPEADS